MEDTGVWAQVRRRVMAAHADPEVSVGWVHDVTPHADYGIPGVAVRVSWMDGDGQITARILWVPMPGVGELLAVMNKLRSPAFTREMNELEKQVLDEKTPES